MGEKALAECDLRKFIVHANSPKVIVNYNFFFCHPSVKLFYVLHFVLYLEDLVFSHAHYFDSVL